MHATATPLPRHLPAPALVLAALAALVACDDAADVDATDADTNGADSAVTETTHEAPSDTTSTPEIDDTTIAPYDPSPTFRLLHQNVITASDLWRDAPEILSAGLGFDGIIGVEGDEAEVRAAGGAWNDVTCSDGAEPPRSARTSSSLPDQVGVVYDRVATNADGLPVVFSWPVLPETVAYSDFRVTLSTGERVTPTAASIFPNFEYNERHVVVLFADFGNRIAPGEAGVARFATRVEVVADDAPLTLLGPDGPVSAVGLAWETTTSPYQSGPYLVGAKLSRLDDAGEG
ncbi:MAG: hypothetical protein IT385_21390, partial [Deltaproteobacteria bacterium]|nr:hypothetical protein [Deltaproteobacteria bacterium]